MPDLQNELRVAIRYNTVRVPSLSSNRAQRIAEDFAFLKLSRHFDYDQDFIHYPTDFDSDIPKWVWILCDFNVRDRLPQVENVPVQFWKVDYDEKHSANFKQYRANAKHFVDHFPWGGRDHEWEYRLQRRAVLSKTAKAVPSMIDSKS
ncbi:MAG: hypothetical protein M1834_006265 [Cirrosporium novae-zelandiae]|nr:MAG: hypothetical protein M1834_006265 [Cirrosporium novae-zelandiae]